MIPMLEYTRVNSNHYRVLLGVDEFPVLVDHSQPEPIRQVRYTDPSTRFTGMSMITNFDPALNRHGHPLIAGTIVGYLRGDSKNIDSVAMNEFGRLYSEQHLDDDEETLYRALF